MAQRKKDAPSNPTVDDLRALESIGLQTKKPNKPGPPRAVEDHESTLRFSTVGTVSSFQVSEAGMKALQAQFEAGEIKQDPSWPRIICMRYGKKDRVVASLGDWGPYGIETMRFTPFSVSARRIHPLLAASIMKRRREAPHGRAFYDWVIEPPVDMVDTENGMRPVEPKKRGDCGGELGWQDKISGTWIQTCPYGNCPRHPLPPGIAHSIYQAQKFLGTLKSEHVIQAYIRDYDNRPDVAYMANLVIAERRRRLQEAMGTGATGSPDIIF